jgi:hypothetical protein
MIDEDPSQHVVITTALAAGSISKILFVVDEGSGIEGLEIHGPEIPDYTMKIKIFY